MPFAPKSCVQCAKEVPPPWGSIYVLCSKNCLDSLWATYALCGWKMATETSMEVTWITGQVRTLGRPCKPHEWLGALTAGAGIAVTYHV